MPERPGKSAVFRFYEELNDLLPEAKRKKSNVFMFSGNPSVKDAIESQNIPHTEVDLILVNGTPVSFGYRLRNDDRVSVYPVFESFDIGSLKKDQEPPLRNPCFVLDVHLGKLARLLRMTGFDTVYRNDLDDAEIISIARSTGRIILTRDKGILKNSSVRKGCYLRSQNPDEQLKEVIARFQLQSLLSFLSRCITCNGSISDVEIEDIEHELKPGTARYFRKFYRCRDCGKIYWEGSHYERMLGYFEKLKTAIQTDGKRTGA